MKITVDTAMMKEYFVNWNRDYYTFEALETLLEYYDEVNPDMELDVIAICCDWNEYGNTPCLKWNDFISDYKHLLEDEENVDNMTDEEKKDCLIEKLEEFTIIYRLSDSILVAAF